MNEILEKGYNIVKITSASNVEIHPIFKWVVVVQDNTALIYDFSGKQITLDAQYSDIELCYPEVYGILPSGDKVKLEYKGNALREKSNRY